jgi:hypothetical protein
MRSPSPDMGRNDGTSNFGDRYRTGIGRGCVSRRFELEHDVGTGGGGLVVVFTVDD